MRRKHQQRTLNKNERSFRCLNGLLPKKIHDNKNRKYTAIEMPISPGKTKWNRETKENVRKIVEDKKPVSFFIEKKHLNWYPPCLEKSQHYVEKRAGKIKKKKT